MIDVGDYFDAAVQSMCMKLGLPLIQGGTFCQQLSVDYFPCPKIDNNWACLLCGNDMMKAEFLEKILPSKILDIDSLEWIPKNDNPIGQSNSYLCINASMLMVA
jgi:hypothetical protein